MKTLLTLLIRAYQKLISPLLGSSCRFYPSCSHYSIECIEKYGVWKGLLKTVVRLIKCGPWHSGGVDLP